MIHRGRGFAEVVGPCTHVYKDGHRCDGSLLVASSKVSDSGRVYYITLTCARKGNHGRSRPGSVLFASEWGYDQDELAERLGLFDEEAA